MSALPRYQQLKQQIIGQISRGELKPRDRVPSENELVGSAGVSRMTANRALRELNDEGYVERVAGVGTFVADLQSASHVLEVRNIADEIARRGHRHSATVIAQEMTRAAEDIADSLRIDRGAPVFHLLLVHRENDVPIQLEDRYVAASFAPDCLEQDFCRQTPSAWLSAIAPLQEAEHRVRAAMPGREIRKYLQLGEREPCLVVIRRTWSHGQPVSLARLYHPGSRYELTGHYTPPGIRKSTAEETP